MPAFPFGQSPTLREFVDVAISKGCQVIEVPGIVGPNGAVDGRCLVGPPPNRIPYPLPGIKDDERLTPSLIGSIERTLGIQTGFPSI
jgi:hypothetical protein